MAKHKYYVVWKGRKPGIYASWAQCREQIAGVKGAQYKAFPNRAMAEAAFKGELKQFSNAVAEEHPNWQSWCVDAACEGNPGLMEYRCVEASTGKEVFRKGPYANSTNNIGEFLAIVHAVALQQRDKLSIPIYSDSSTAITWVRKKKAASKLPREPKTEHIWQMLERAEQWLRSHSVHVPVMKWQTESWGENPADFGRK